MPKIQKSNANWQRNAAGGMDAVCAKKRPADGY